LHISEWGADYSSLEAEVTAYFDKIIAETDSNVKEDLETKKTAALEALKPKVESLDFWSKVKVASNKPEGIPSFGNDASSDAQTPSYIAWGEPQAEETSTIPFPTSPKVYHFHPIAFVEQMRRMDNVWHDPVQNPQLNKYTFSGNINPSNGVFGNVRTWRTPSLHSGTDIFAISGNKVYACMEGEVVRADTGGGGKTVVIKIKSTIDFIRQMSNVNYSLTYANKGEVMGTEVKSTDSVYLIYMHLSKFECEKGDKVNSGDLVALAGVTGNATGTRGPHVHFEIATKSNPYGSINPARVVEQQPYDTKEQDDSKDYKYYKDGTKKKV